MNCFKILIFFCDSKTSDLMKSAKFKKNCIHISYLDPYNESELIEEFKNNQITAISMEMIPRTTRAQKMDAMSSQANLAGYVTVMLAAEKLPRILPMMMTPAGTLKPANVFVIGVGSRRTSGNCDGKTSGRKSYGI